MTERVAQSSGGVIHAAHIERPEKAFCVQWFSPAYDNVLRFADTIRTQIVLAETDRGALVIAQFHHRRGCDFKLVPIDENSRDL